MGDWCKLLSHIEKCLEAPKFETFVYSVPLLTESVIDVKYQTLKKRVKLASLSAAAISAVPIPGVSVVANTCMVILMEEVLHYINVFGLGKTIIDALVGFDCSKLNCSVYLVGHAFLTTVIIKQLGKYSAILAAESFLSVVPFLGSIIASFTPAVLTYRFLNTILDDFRDDAHTVYRFVAINRRA